MHKGLRRKSIVASKERIKRVDPKSSKAGGGPARSRSRHDDPRGARRDPSSVESRSGADNSGRLTAVPVVGMISAFPELFEEAAARLVQDLGPVLLKCDVFPFDFTEYYNVEMGRDLLRTYVAFDGRVSEDALYAMKTLSTSREREFLHPGTSNRRINLDPGVVTADHLVLASHKRAAHRICIKDGVFGELELIYVEGGFQPLPWTYPDYRTQVARSFFERIRAVLLGR